MRLKNIILVVSLMLTSATLHAQKVASGDIKCLQDQTAVNLDVDFSNCMIVDVPATVKMSSEPNWEKGVSEISARFSRGSIRYGFYINDKSDSRYTLIYHLATIDDDQDTTGTIEVRDNTTGTTVAVIEKANGKAGHFGSFFNLLGDAFENLGKKIGKLIKAGK